MTRIQTTTAFPSGADWSAGAARTWHAAQSVQSVESVTEMRSSDMEFAEAVVIRATGGFYARDAASVADDDGESVIHDMLGRRYVLREMVSGAVADAVAEAEGYRDETEAFAAMAVDARDIYPDAATGLAAVADGKYYWVASAVSGEIAALYRDVSGVATDTGKRAPDNSAVSATVNAMFGSMDLWRWVEASGAGLYIRRYRTLTTVNTSAYRFVLHAKAGTRKRIGLYSNTGVVFSASFDLELRTAVLHFGTAVLTVTYLANGTVECVVEVTATSAAAATIQIFMLDASSLPGNARTGDGTSTIYPHSLRAYKDNVELWPTDSGAFSTAPWTGSSITMTAHAAQYLGVLGALTPPEASTLILDGVKVDIIGNSLAAGLWPASFASLTGADIDVHATGGAALGIDGRGSPHYGSGVMMDHLENDTRAAAEVILIDMCVNDIAASDVPLGTVSDTTNATYAGALAQANSWAKTNRPNAKLIFVVPTAANSSFATSDYRHGFANANGNFVEDFQVMTRRMANILGRPAIDPNAFGVGFLDTENTSDGLHWDASGALKIAKIYAAEMTRLAEAGWLES